MPLTVDDLGESVYLTDETSLYRVLRAWAPSGQVMLEDVGDPSAPAVVVPVAQLVAEGMRVVRPEIAGP